MTTQRSVVQQAATIIARTHAASLHRFYQRAAQALDNAGLLRHPDEQGVLDLTEKTVA